MSDGSTIVVQSVTAIPSEELSTSASRITSKNAFLRGAKMLALIVLGLVSLIVLSLLMLLR